MYPFIIHPEVLSQTEFLFKYYRPWFCCCRRSSYWTVHLDEPHSFTRIQQYAYYKLIGEGIHVKNKARVTLFETGGGFVSIPESVLSGVNMILVISKEGSDSGLLHRRQVPVQHPYLKRLTVEQIIKTDLEEGTGIVYDDERYIEFINGKFQAIFLSFEK